MLKVDFSKVTLTSKQSITFEVEREHFPSKYGVTKFIVLVNFEAYGE